MPLVEYASLLLLATLSHVTTSTNEEKASVCGQGVCGNISYSEILRMYRGLFFTEEELVQKEHKILIARKKNLANEGLDAAKVLGLPGDGDSCCATEFTHVKKTALLNTDDILRYIVHMPDASPPMSQLIPEGSCVSGYGDCDGQCFMEPLTLNLLVFDTSPTAAWPPLTFDWFEVPGYCSCKNSLLPIVGSGAYVKLPAAAAAMERSPEP